MHRREGYDISLSFKGNGGMVMDLDFSSHTLLNLLNKALGCKACIGTRAHTRQS
jgi:hypothetical protein